MPLMFRTMIVSTAFSAISRNSLETKHNSLLRSLCPKFWMIRSLSSRGSVDSVPDKLSILPMIVPRISGGPSRVQMAKMNKLRSLKQQKISTGNTYPFLSDDPWIKTLRLDAQANYLLSES